jgi:hypothetical protein
VCKLLSNQVPKLIQAWPAESIMLDVDAFVAWLGQDVWGFDFSTGKCGFRDGMWWPTRTTSVQFGDLHSRAQSKFAVCGV